MGLCDKERSKYLFFSVKRLNNILREWKSYQKSEEYRSPIFEELMALVEQSFHALLGNQSNGLHWFMGSSTSNIIRDNMEADPWSLPIGNFLSKSQRDSFFWDENTNLPWKVEDSYSIDVLLKISNHVDESYTFKIFKEIETSIYALRRYDDGYLSKQEKLNKLISDISGICFSIFSDDECFAKAYLINRILHLIYTDSYPHKKDCLTEMKSMEYGYSHASNMKDSLKDLSDTHIQLVQAFELETLDVKTRFLAMAGLIRTESLAKEFIENATKVKELQPFIKDAESKFVFAKPQQQEQYEVPSELEVYGSYEITSEFLQKKELIKAQKTEEASKVSKPKPKASKVSKAKRK